MAACLMTACAPILHQQEPAQRPLSRPDITPAAAPAGPAMPLDPELVLAFAATEAQMVDRGLLRTDPGEPITDPDRLARTFLRIALFDEYAEIGGAIVARETQSSLRRWEEPVRVALVFGDALPGPVRDADRATVEAVTERLARASGHPVSAGDEPANFEVFVVSEAERQALGPTLSARVPGITPAVLEQITALPEAVYCLVVAFSDTSEPAVYRKAIAIVRAELPTLLRHSCYHEEIAQGMGLANDSPEARPSLFNDDKEFAVLTGQDDLMLAMLYDPRLRPGMTITEAAPIAETIARDLLSGLREAAISTPDPQGS